MKFQFLRLVLFAALLFGGFVPSKSVQATSPESLSGWFTIVWGDASDGSTSMQYSLKTDNGDLHKLIFDEALAQSLGGVLALNGKRVSVRGDWARVSTISGEGVAFKVESLSLLSESASEDVSGLVSGSQPWVSIMCKFSDYATEPKNLAYFQGMYGASSPGLDHYWREVSYNTVNVVGSTAVGWYVLPQPRSYYVYNNSLNFDRAANDCTAAADPYVNFANVVGINLMFNAELDGYAWGGSNYMTLDGVTKLWRMTWEPPWGYADVTVIAHEMGHGFGLPHSSGNYGQTYDNRWDVMSDTWSDCGNSTDATYGCLGQHTISYHKDILGWIPANQKFIPTGGTENITLEQLALPQTSNYKIAQISIGGSSTHFYTVEVRRKTGYDVKLPGAAVVIHEVNTTRERPAYVIDADGNGNTGDAGAMWTVGETFTDSLNGISVYVSASTATGYQVSITTPGIGPAAFNKISPITGQTVQLSGATLTWGTSNGSTSYEYCYDTSNNATCDSSWNSTLSTSAVLPSLNSSTTYYWQVRANNAFGTTYANSGSWWNFKTSTPGPNSLEPGNVVPESAVNIHTRRPTFKWEAVTGATSYVLEATNSANCSSFATTLFRRTVTTTSYIPTLDLAANSEYCWRVKANGLGWSSAYSQVRIFLTGNPPTAPSPKTPLNNALMATLRPSFDWLNSTLAIGTAFDRYEFQIDTALTFASAATYTTAAGDINDSDFTLLADLIPATTYYWRVRALNTAGDFSGWSAIRIVRTAYAAPTLLNPTNLSTNIVLKPTFTWQTVIGATSYTIQVSKVSAFTTVVINKTVLTTSYTHGLNLTPNTIYYWRVRINGLYGPSPWSLPFQFTTAP